jgi:hypothetical protein
LDCLFSDWSYATARVRFTGGQYYNDSAKLSLWGSSYTTEGGGGTAIATAAMRALPIGFPKLMVSTLASGQTAPYVGTTDITMMPAIVDVSGLNRLSRVIFTNAAGAIAGMVAAIMTKVAAMSVCRPAERCQAAEFLVA